MKWWILKAEESESVSCSVSPTLCHSMDCSTPGPSVHGILQATIMELVVISFFRGSSWPRDWRPVSCIAGRFFMVSATREAHKQNRFCKGTKNSFLKPWPLDCTGYKMKMSCCTGMALQENYRISFSWSYQDREVLEHFYRIEELKIVSLAFSRHHPHQAWRLKTSTSMKLEGLNCGQISCHSAEWSFFPEPLPLLACKRHSWIPI